MTRNLELGLMEQSVVRELANVGLGHATTALADMTGRAFNMLVPNVESVPLERIPELLGGDDTMSVGIFMPISGETGGHIAFMLDWRSAQSLWKMLLGSAPEDPESVGEMEASALLEIGNIINSSFLSAISDMTGLNMESTPPAMSIDYSYAILSAVVSEAALQDSIALSLQTVIHDYEHSFEGYFLFIPTYGGLQTVFAKLGIAEAA